MQNEEFRIQNGYRFSGGKSGISVYLHSAFCILNFLDIVRDVWYNYLVEICQFFRRILCGFVLFI